MSKNQIKASIALNERGNRSYGSNFIFPKAENTSSNIYIVCGSVGAGVMYRGEQVAEQIATGFANYINTNTATAEADSQADLLSKALLHSEAHFSEYVTLHPECYGIGGTLACVNITDSGVVVGWVGDTRVLLVRNGAIVSQTTDHSAKYPYEEFSIQPRRSIQRLIEGSDKPAIMDIEWWTDVRDGDMIVIGTYAIVRPIEQGFMDAAWAAGTPADLRDALKMSCDAHARDNYAALTLYVGEPAAASEVLSAPLAAEGLPLVTLRSLDAAPAAIPLAVAEEDEAETAPATAVPEVDNVEIAETTDDIETADTTVEQEEEAAPEVAAAVPEVDNVVQEVVQEVPAPVVPIETPVSTTPPTKPLIGNYVYEDEDDKAGSGFIWNPIQKPTEVVTETVDTVTDTTNNVVDDVVDSGKEVVTDAKDAITGAVIGTIGAGAAVVAGTTDLGKDAVKSIKDKFIPTTETPKTARVQGSKDTDIKTVIAPEGKGLGYWGIRIAALVIGIACIAWLASLFFGGKATGDKATADFMTNMRQDLYTQPTAQDSLNILNDYITKANQPEWAGKISKDSMAHLQTFAAGLSSRVNATSDEGVAATAKPADADEPADAAAAKQTATDMSVKTAVKTPAPKTAAAPKVVNTDEGGKPVPSIAARPAASKNSNPFAKYTTKWAAKDGFCVVEQGGKWGWLHADGKPFIGVAYEAAQSFSGGYAPAKKGGKWGFVDADGKVAVPFQYASVQGFGSKCAGKAVVSDGKANFFIDNKGAKVAACE